MNLENFFWLLAILAEVAVVVLLVQKRVFRLFPIFCVYCVWELLTDSANYPIRLFLSDSGYLTAYLTETAFESAFQFCVLVELAWSVLRPIRASLPRFSWYGLVAFILLGGVIVWPFASMHAQLSPQGQVLMHLMQTVSILRIVFFLALAGCSQLLSLSWRDRELQIATGLGIYSIVSLAVTMFHPQDASPEQNQYYNLFVAAGYVITMIYWAISLLQQEAERKEFTPQMQNLLLAMAGVARADREALAQRSITNAQSRRKS